MEDSDQRQKFYQLLQKHIDSLDYKFRQTFSISAETFTKVISALLLKKGEKCEHGSKFKFWSKQHFVLPESHDDVGLYCRKTMRPVVKTDEMFEIIKDCHERVGHAGRERTCREIQDNYAYIKNDAVSLFLQTCPSCSARQLSRKPAAGGKAATSQHHFMSCLRMEVLDMSDSPDGSFRYVLHLQDDFSEFNWAYPLKSGSVAADEVTAKLIEVFCLFGFPKTLESDAGQELVDECIVDLRDTWPDLTMEARGRPNRQRCMDEDNDNLLNRLLRWTENNESRWSQGLKFVVHEMNTSKSPATGSSPYELVFGQHAKAYPSQVEQQQDKHKQVLMDDDGSGPSSTKHTKTQDADGVSSSSDTEMHGAECEKVARVDGPTLSIAHPGTEFGSTPIGSHPHHSLIEEDSSESFESLPLKFESPGPVEAVMIEPTAVQDEELDKYLHDHGGEFSQDGESLQVRESPQDGKSSQAAESSQVSTSNHAEKRSKPNRRLKNSEPNCEYYVVAGKFGLNHAFQELGSKLGASSVSQRTGVAKHGLPVDADHSEGKRTASQLKPTKIIRPVSKRRSLRVHVSGVVKSDLPVKSLPDSENRRTASQLNPTTIIRPKWYTFSWNNADDTAKAAYDNAVLKN